MLNRTEQKSSCSQEATLRLLEFLRLFLLSLVICLVMDWVPTSFNGFQFLNSFPLTTLNKKNAFELFSVFQVRCMIKKRSHRKTIQVPTYQGEIVAQLEMLIVSFFYWVRLWFKGLRKHQKVMIDLFSAWDLPCFFPTSPAAALRSNISVQWRPNCVNCSRVRTGGRLSGKLQRKCFVLCRSDSWFAPLSKFLQFFS